MNAGGMHDGDRAERVRAAVGVAVQVDHSQTQAHRSKESQEERGEGEGEEAEGQVVGASHVSIVEKKKRRDKEEIRRGDRRKVK